jgi:hypothetical protein
MKIQKPNQVSYSYTQRLVAPPEAVIPLLCPVREADWIEGWDPVVVYSHSGVAEPGCVFVTAAKPENAIWYITHHDTGDGYVEMIKITPAVTACKLAIEVRATGTGSQATITYSHTSLGPAGDAFLESFTKEKYDQSMRDWEARINHYLEHGRMLKLPETG